MVGPMSKQNRTEMKNPEDEQRKARRAVQENPQFRAYSEEQRAVLGDKKESEEQKASKDDQRPGVEPMMSENQPMPQIQQNVEAQRNSSAKQRFEAQQAVKASQATKAGWISELLAIPENRRVRPRQQGRFQNHYWGPMARTWATTPNMVTEHVMTNETFQLQTNEISVFLQLKNAMMLVEEFLKIAVMLKKTVQGTGEIPCSKSLVDHMNYAFGRVVNAAKILNTVRLALVRKVISGEVKVKDDVLSLEQDIARFTVPFAAVLSRHMPIGATGIQWVEMDQRGIQNVIAKASELETAWKVGRQT
ncbi:MAG: hypothetical protein Q9213_004358 [Squamulea squamosa]